MAFMAYEEAGLNVDIDGRVILVILTIFAVIIGIMLLMAYIGIVVYGIGLVSLWFVYRKAIKLCLIEARKVEGS